MGRKDAARESTKAFHSNSHVSSLEMGYEKTKMYICIATNQMWKKSSIVARGNGRKTPHNSGYIPVGPREDGSRLQSCAQVVLPNSIIRSRFLNHGNLKMSKRQFPEFPRQPGEVEVHVLSSCQGWDKLVWSVLFRSIWGCFQIWVSRRFPKGHFFFGSLSGARRMTLFCLIAPADIRHHRSLFRGCQDISRELQKNNQPFAAALFSSLPLLVLRTDGQKEATE